MRPPVILCAFSNSGDAYLSQLEKEKEAISDALRERQGKGHLLLDTDYRTIKKLRDRLLLYQPQVEIIHYAGHANGSQLLMEDGTVYGAGLLESIRCLDPNETLSPGQAEEITRVSKAYPHLVDDDFVRDGLSRWLVP